MPEHYRKFLLGQSPGRAAIVTYTHLNEIRRRFEEAVQRQFQPLVDAIVGGLRSFVRRRHPQLNRVLELSY